MIYKYNICLSVPLGMRYGYMIFDADEGHVNGKIHVLGKDQLFNGTVNESGRILISGSLDSLTSNYFYDGEGHMDDEKIQINLVGKTGNYLLEGTRT